MKKDSPSTTFIIIKSGAGFSLIELLVVISIIGIIATVSLTSFSGARRVSRDALRIADMQQVAQALQLYYLKCNMFPGSYSSVSGCEGGFTTLNNPGDWQGLETILKNAEIGVTSIPNDPTSGIDYRYHVQVRVGSGGLSLPRAQCYVLIADLETDHRALQNDIDASDINKKLLGGSGAEQKNLYPPVTATICDENGTNREYCIGNIECFHGS